MPIAVVRFVVAAVAALALATVPVYPGAVSDAARMKKERQADPKRTNAAYLTPDSFEKVMAFYKAQPGAKQDNTFSIGNTENEKIGLFYIGDQTVAINWPESMTDKSGKRVAATAFSIDKTE
jgi:hypothetical protein